MSIKDAVPGIVKVKHIVKGLKEAPMMKHEATGISVSQAFALEVEKHSPWLGLSQSRKPKRVKSCQDSRFIQPFFSRTFFLNLHNLFIPTLYPL